MLNLLFVDIETNGTKIDKHGILEISAILTDDNLNQIGIPFHSLVFPYDYSVWWEEINPMGNIVRNMDSFVFNMHKNNGLLQELKSLVDNGNWQLFKTLVVEERWLTWLDNLTVGKQNLEIRMAGHSINSLDRPFIKHFMPKMYEKLSHRTVDISMIGRFFSDVAKIPFTLVKAPHRAEEDNFAAIQEARKIAKWTNLVYGLTADKLSF